MILSLILGVALFAAGALVYAWTANANALAIFSGLGAYTLIMGVVAHILARKQ